MLQTSFESAQARLAIKSISEARSATIIASSFVLRAPQWRDEQASLRQRSEPDRRRPRVSAPPRGAELHKRQRGSEPPRMTGGVG